MWTRSYWAASYWYGPALSTGAPADGAARGSAGDDEAYWARRARLFKQFAATTYADKATHEIAADVAPDAASQQGDLIRRDLLTRLGVPEEVAALSSSEMLGLMSDDEWLLVASAIAELA